MSEIIPFTPRPKPAEPEPPRQLAEFILDDKTCGLTLTLALADAIVGQPAVLRYKLVETPPDFDLNLLREHWARLREATAGGDAAE